MNEVVTNFLFLIISVFLSVSSILIGSFLFLKPAAAIELQRKFYEKINWRMEPISMPREIKSTKIMGLFLFSVGLAAIIYVVIGPNQQLLY